MVKDVRVGNGLMVVCIAARRTIVPNTQIPIRVVTERARLLRTLFCVLSIGYTHFLASPAVEPGARSVDNVASDWMRLVQRPTTSSHRIWSRRTEPPLFAILYAMPVPVGVYVSIGGTVPARASAWLMLKLRSAALPSSALPATLPCAQSCPTKPSALKSGTGVRPGRRAAGPAASACRDKRHSPNKQPQEPSELHRTELFESG